MAERYLRLYDQVLTRTGRPTSLRPARLLDHQGGQVGALNEQR
jgi:hypothetical protein